MPGSIQISRKNGLDALHIEHIARYSVSPRPCRSIIYGERAAGQGFFLSAWMDNGSAFDLAWFEDAPTAKAKYHDLLKTVANAGPTTLVKFPAHESLSSYVPNPADVLTALDEVAQKLGTISALLPG